MNKKTIWYCHHYAGAPSLGMSYRPYYLTREFYNAGHNAYIISADSHHLLQKTATQNVGVKLNKIDGVNFIQLKTWRYKGNGLSRMLNMLSYAIRIGLHKKHIETITGKPDVIIVSSAHLFHYPVLERIAKTYGATLIFEVRDLWPLSLIEILKLNRFNPLIMWLARIERRGYRNAHHVVSLLDAAFPYMASKGLVKNKFHVIPNGASVGLFKTHGALSLSVADYINKLKKQNLFLLGYAGALGSPNAMEYLVAAMALIAEKNLPIHCVIVGDGGLKIQLESEAVRLNLNNISFLPAIPKFEIPAFLSQMDVLYLGWNAANLYKYGVSPNKMFDYMMAGKPIIESGNIKESIIHKFGCGIQCEASNPIAIADAIVNMHLKTNEELHFIGNLGKTAVETFYDYKILARQYMDIL